MSSKLMVTIWKSEYFSKSSGTLHVICGVSDMKLKQLCTNSYPINSEHNLLKYARLLRKPDNSEDMIHCNKAPSKNYAWRSVKYESGFILHS